MLISNTVVNYVVIFSFTSVVGGGETLTFNDNTKTMKTSSYTGGKVSVVIIF